MASEVAARYLQRLPNFITFFFSIMLVRNLGELTTVFKMTTGPEFDKFGLGDWLIILSFFTTLFFVVLCWLAYNVLVDRFPYTVNYTFFFLDVVRFSLLYVVMNFAFLAAHPPTYLYYIISLGVFHTFAMSWHLLRLSRGGTQAERAEHFRDMRFLAMISAIYYGLAIVYGVTVTLSWHSSNSWALHSVFVVVTCAIVIWFSANRLHAMRVRVFESEPPAQGVLAK